MVIKITDNTELCSCDVKMVKHVTQLQPIFLLVLLKQIVLSPRNHPQTGLPSCLLLVLPLVLLSSPLGLEEEGLVVVGLVDIGLDAIGLVDTGLDVIGLAEIGLRDSSLPEGSLPGSCTALSNLR